MILSLLILSSAFFPQSLGSTPPDPSTLLKEADAIFRSGKEVSSSLKLYNEAIQLLTTQNDKSGLSKAFYSRHKVNVKLSKLPRAISDLTEAINADPSYAMAYLQRANLELTIGKCAEAVSDYEKTLALDPQKRDAIARLPHAKACEHLIQQADQLASQHRWQEVRSTLEQALTPDRAYSSPTLLLKKAEASMAMGDLEQTLADSAKVLKIEPNNPPAYSLRGRALYLHGDYTTSRAHFLECSKFDPEYVPCKDGYKLLKSIIKVKENGEKEMNAHKWKEAIEAYSAGITLDESNSHWMKEVLPLLAKAYLKSEDSKHAISFAQRAISLSDDIALAHAVLSEAYMLLEDFDLAVRHGKRAHELDRGNNEYQTLAAKAEAAQKQSKQKDFYKTLGVPRNADEKKIKSAYRKLAKEWHPDMHQGEEAKELAEKKFHEIAQAYEILSDAEKRAQYDRGEDVLNQGGQQQQQSGFPGGFGGFPGGFGGFPGGGFPGGGFQQQGGFQFHFRQG